MNSRIPGMELTREPFRWDQRFFSVIIRIPGVRGDDKPIQEEPVRDTSVLEGFSCMTGGKKRMTFSLSCSYTEVSCSMQYNPRVPVVNCKIMHGGHSKKSVLLFMQPPAEFVYLRKLRPFLGPLVRNSLGGRFSNTCMKRSEDQSN